VFPVLGIIVISGLTGRHEIGQSMHIGVPLVAILLGLQAAVLDDVIVRSMLRANREPSPWRYIASCNVGIAMTAVGSLLWWVLRHPPKMIA
jgi:hypothetical protein